MNRILNTTAGHLPFLHEEDGSATVWSLFLLAAISMLAGLAVDVSNVTTARTSLQVVADVSAHAALLKWELGSVREAKSAALAAAA